MKASIVVLTGAGISAESGIPTFRGSGGLWEGYDIQTVASPQGWEDDPELVLNFYNERRKFALACNPNPAHYALTLLEKKYDVQIITQNVDDLHERAKNSNILHLHGELNKVQSSQNGQLIYPWKGELKLGDVAEDGSQLRPHIVWFGEPVPLLQEATVLCQKASIAIIVGTSMQVYPAAGLINFCPLDTTIYYVDPNPAINVPVKNKHRLHVIQSNATEAIPKLVEQLL